MMLMSQLPEGQPNSFPFLVHLDGLVEELRRFTPAALDDFDENSVHKARVTTRRLKAAIDLLDPVLERDHSKPFSKIGRKLRKRLGSLRDVDVLLSHLDEIKSGSSELTGGAEWLRDRLLRDREDVRHESSKRSPAARVVAKLATWSRVREDVVQAQPALPSLLAESMHVQLDYFIDQANQLRTKLQGGDIVEPTATKHDPHELRIAGKSLRYTLELADAAGHELPGDLFKTFKKMQESLGDWHDYVVLAERAMAACLEEDLPLHEPRMQREVLKLIDYAMTHAEADLNRFMELWEEKGQELSEKIRDAFVLTRAGELPGEAPVSTVDPGRNDQASITNK